MKKLWRWVVMAVIGYAAVWMVLAKRKEHLALAQEQAERELVYKRLHGAEVEYETRVRDIKAELDTKAMDAIVDDFRKRFGA